MELKTDAILRGPIWAEMLDKLTDTIFKTNWDVYALSIAIGMMYDSQIETVDMVPDDYDAEPRYVPRNVLGHSQHKALLEFMLQTATITTKHLDLDEDSRLQLAFKDDSSMKKETTENEENKNEFNPITFLTKYANYGITKIHEVVSDTDDVETMESLMTFLNEIYEAGVDIIEQDIDIEM